MSTGRKRLLAYVIMVISGLVSIKLVKDIIKLTHTDERIIEAEKELLVVKEEQIKLNQEMSRIQEGDWWESQVRNTLKMARNNEEVVIVPEEVLKSASKVVRPEIEEEREMSNVEKWKQVFGIINTEEVTNTRRGS